MRINPISPIYRHSHKKRDNDNAYLQWLRTMPSALSGGYPTEACHYRTANNSGVGIKPLYSAIPLTPAEHREQHRIGQFNFRPREWWEEQVKAYLKLWKDSISA